MFIPGKTKDFELEINKSRFISRCWPVESRNDATRLVENLKAEHPDAAHVVYAYRIGEKNSLSQGMSDDGEPGGTAGKPCLDAMLWADVTNCCISVVRYFGGTKLGAGGLVRAYRQAAQGALENGELQEQISRTQICISLAYNVHNSIIHSNIPYSDVVEEFAESVTMTFVVISERRDEVLESIMDISNGSAKIEWVKEIS